MAGKSNIVDVFKFLFEAVYPAPGADGVANAMAVRGGMPEVVWKGSDHNLVTFELEGARGLDSDVTYVYRLEILSGQGGYTYIQQESLKMRRQGREVDLITQDGSQRSLKNMNGTQVTSVMSSGKSALERAPTNWDGFQVVNSLASWRFYQLVPAIMKQPNQVGTGRVLQRHGENLSAWLMGIQTRYPDNFDRINSVMRDVFPSIRNVITWPTENGLVHVASYEEGLQRPVNVWAMSDGELVFLALLSLIYSPLEVGSDLFCIEEPENHLHPRLLSTLVELTRQVRQELQDRRVGLSQMIVTTQSPYLVDEMTLDEIIWVERKRGETHAVRPANKKDLRARIDNEELGLGDVVYTGLLSDKE